MRRFWSLIAAVPCVLALFVTPLIPVRDANAQGLPAFIGEIRWVAFNFAPPGWAPCAGQILQINQNVALFSLLGTTYGGDGRTTFGIPDLRGRVQIGQGMGPGLTLRNLGDEGGEETVTLTVNQMPAHTHPALATTNTATSDSPAGRVLANVSAGGPDPKIYSSGDGNVSLGASTIGAVGGGQPHDNMPPFLTLNCIIAVEGIFPSRQ